MLKKLFSRLNVIDIIIISVLLAILISIIFRLSTNGSVNAKNEYELQFLCSDCPVSVFAGINENDECIDYDTQKLLGTVTAKNTSENFDSNGTLVLKISVTGKQLSHGINVGGTQLLTGKYINIIISDCVVTARIESISFRKALK